MWFSSTIIAAIGRPSVARAVQSVLDQALPQSDFEVIVVNDSGAPLPGGDWQRSPRVRQIATQRRGQCVARNTGAAIAQGEFLHFLDDDDWLLPGALASFWELAQQAPRANWLYGGVRLVDAAGTSLREFNPGFDGNLFTQLVAGIWILPLASLIRATAFFDTDGFYPTLPIVEDTDLGRQLSLRNEAAHTSAVVAAKLNGAGWKTSAGSSYGRTTEINRWSRDRALARPGAFGRLRGSAHGAYWRGRVLQAYLAGARWNWQRRLYAIATSRAVHALASAALDGPWLLSSAYWQALRDEHVPYSAMRLLQGLPGL